MGKAAQISKTKDLAESGVLYAPASFLDSPVSLLAKIINGCGAANARFDFVPDTIWGIDISSACDIHDFMYSEGRSIEDKEEADRIFRNNLMRLVNRVTGWRRFFLSLIRIRVALYYHAVDEFGGPAFWNGKIQ